MTQTLIHRKDESAGSDMARHHKGKGVGVILRYSSLAKIDTDPFSAGSGELAIDASAQGALKMYNWWDEE
jgi:hypothetical protein